MNTSISDRKIRQTLTLAKNEAAGLPWVSPPPPLTAGRSRAGQQSERLVHQRGTTLTRTDPNRRALEGASPPCARGLRAPLLARSTAARSRTDERAHRRGGWRRRRHLRPEATARFTRVREKEKKVKKGSL